MVVLQSAIKPIRLALSSSQINRKRGKNRPELDGEAGGIRPILHAQQKDEMMQIRKREIDKAESERAERDARKVGTR